MTTGKEILTVFTPTYNRANYLGKAYESLKKQTCHQFKWLIIDDGSTDDTEAVVQEFFRDRCIDLEYIYQSNGGKHAAINHLLDIVESELVLILDSDDYLSETAVETVIDDYMELKKQNSDQLEELCEMIYLKADFSGNIVGTEFPGTQIIDARQMIAEKIGSGDKCNVILTDKFKKCRFPVHENERFMGETVLWYQVYRQFHKVFVSNKVLYHCEYLDTGLTKLGRQLRINTPLGGMDYAKSLITIGNPSFAMKCKASLLYVSYERFAGKSNSEAWTGAKDNLKCDFVRSCYLPGILLYHYWKFKYSK